VHDKELCRALPFPKAHDKGLCRAKMRRAPEQNPHGKGRAVRVLAHGKGRVSGSARPILVKNMNIKQVYNFLRIQVY
jgi:hypothetical protein